MADIDKLIVCDCAGTMALEPETLGRAAGAGRVKACTGLCRAEIAVAEAALAEPGTVVIACGQEAALFEEIAGRTDAARLVTADIRDRAGWTADGRATAKQAALLADALVKRPTTPARELVSDGICLVLGEGDVALDAARRLSGTLAVTCVLGLAPDAALPETGFDLALGRLRSATGSFTAFDVTIDGFAPADPAGRGGLTFERPRDGARSRCDVIVDLTGGAPLFPAPEKRDGHLRADPRDPVAVERALFDAAGLVGEFEKPLHIRFHAEICAHSRAGQTGCERCLDVCPTGAITPDGDTVRIDPGICAGCGACAAVCPSGAAAYDDPPAETLFHRLRAMARAFAQAGADDDDAPRALFHDGHGAEMIRLSARFGRGLPADVIPVDVPDVEGVGHAEMLCALGTGFAGALVLAGPRTDRSALGPQTELARAIVAGAGHVPEILGVIEPADPDALEEALYGAARAALDITPMLPLGGRREVTRLAATALAPGATAPMPLPQGAPYGAVVIDPEACTLCLACVSLCPVGALSDNSERPQVAFQETACLQCGICETACPENAITLEPRLDLSNAAMTRRVLHEEEPFECVECGKPFGVRSTIERIVEKLEGKNWMYTGSDNTRLIRMCDDCRVRAQMHGETSPFRMGDRPRIRTADDPGDG